MLVSTFTITIEAPGIAPPLGSVTMPVMEPVMDWAFTDEERVSNNNKNTQERHFMLKPPH
jgi:hypothetical protein